ncbi:MAG: 4-hydroxy-3-methylbut-2-enyl diphosphate reductase [Candidatus Omnitrophica bacterium]|nr:4-hydroxy-3-methylbut-2-enyl diphosphate reductase [Candidatus Omnitrophota bacterium]
MKINVAKSAGFCFGVKRALDIALKTAKSKKLVYMLEDIVHNETVVRQINKAGIRKIDNLASGKNKILLIRAHGAPLAVIRKARISGYEIIDATCPMVKEIHKIAKDMENIGYDIIVIGDKKHDEVVGIIGQLESKAIVVDSLENIPIKKLKRIKKACIVVQSTQNLDNVEKIVGALRNYIKDLRFFNTICMPTRIKQKDIKIMPQDNEIMMIIGSKTSANTKRLYEISRSLNKQTYWVNSTKDLRRAWFKKAKTVGITAGASTPNSTTQEIIKHIRQIHNPSTI